MYFDVRGKMERTLLCNIHNSRLELLNSPPRHLVSLQIGFIHYFTLTRIQCEKREHLFHFRCRDIKLYVQFVSKNEFMKRYETRHCILVRFISRRSHSEVVFNSRYCFHRYVKKCVYHNVKKMPLTLT